MKKRISVILLLTLVLALCLSAVAMATVQLMEVEDGTCKHENTVYVDNKDGMHNRVCKACGKVLETKDCVYDLVDAIAKVNAAGGTFTYLETDRGKIGGLLEKGYIYESNDGTAVDTFAQSASDVSVVPCTHESANVNPETGKCACGMQMTLKTEVKDGETTTTTYGTDLVAVLNDAPKGAVVTLLANVSSDSTAELEISANITIDLNGKTLNHGNTIDIDGKLKIVGSGNVNCNIINSYGTLDLSGWESGTIVGVLLEYEAVSFTSGAGKIDFLRIVRPAYTTVNLKSGTYSEIKVARTTVIKKLLAEGYVFKAADGLYHRNADELTTQGSLDNVTVVACPHKNITVGSTGGTCDYCGLSNIVATVGDKVYTASDTIEVAVSEWVGERGGTLTLYAAYSKAEFTSFAPAKGKLLTLDLNGFPFNKDTVMTLGGAYLTVLD